MYKLDVAVDTREAAAIERRQNMEKQRQSRIFNARQRTIGVDIEALDYQIQERKRREEIEKQRHMAFANEMKRTDKIAEIMQQRKEKEIQALNKSLVEYRKENQRTEDRREFDLNDPDFKQKDIPARISDEDPRLSISGMQVFSGEDLQYDSRQDLQKEQTTEWLSQQISEKKRLSMEQKKADQLYNMKAVEMDQRAVELAEADEATRRSLNIAIKDYNQALFKEKAALQQQSIAQEQDDNFIEMSNHIHSDMLTENPAVAQSAFGPHRVIPDRWKGMSPSQVSEILHTQALQREEKSIILKEEQELEREWERRRLAEARAGLLLELQTKKTKEQLQKELATENKQLAAEQRARQEVMNCEVYTNPPNEDYFAQFGTSSR